MIRSIQVDGLKSLNDFRLDLTPGLNVLIGPNGGGKSNIITVFELIANLNEFHKVNETGGISSSRLPELFDFFREEKNIKISIEGVTNTNINQKNKIENKIELVYKYVFEICLLNNDKKYSELNILNQFLDFEFFYNKYLHEFSVESDGENPNFLKCDNLIVDNLVKNIKTKKIEFKENSSPQKVLTEYFEYIGNEPLVREFGGIFYPLKSVLSDIDSIKTFNIDPYAIRSVFENSIDVDLIQNGGGIERVLLEIYEKANNSKGKEKKSDHLCDNYQETYESIIFYLKQFLPNFENLRFIESDDGSNVEGYLKFANKPEIPIKLLSDGTMKLVTLITLLLTNKGLIAIEEPENFLQPKVQQQVIELMREISDDQSDVIIFTTHSETIIDMFEPEEIIFVRLENAQTRAGRFENPDKLKEAIYKSGLGLGWFYVNRALEKRRLTSS